MVWKKYMGITIVTSRCLTSCLIIPLPVQLCYSNVPRKDLSNLVLFVCLIHRNMQTNFFCCCYDTDCNASILIEKKPVCLLFSPDEFTLAGNKKEIRDGTWFLTSCRGGITRRQQTRNDENFLVLFFSCHQSTLSRK